MPDKQYLLALCDRIADAANDAIKSIVGTFDANNTLYTGADGTPTKLIDDISEKAIFEEKNNKLDFNYESRGTQALFFTMANGW